jgi:hypothetical protein
MTGILLTGSCFADAGWIRALDQVEDNSMAWRGVVETEAATGEWASYFTERKAFREAAAALA